MRDLACVSTYTVYVSVCFSTSALFIYLFKQVLIHLRSFIHLKEAVILKKNKNTEACQTFHRARQNLILDLKLERKLVRVQPCLMHLVLFDPIWYFFFFKGRFDWSWGIKIR